MTRPPSRPAIPPLLKHMNERTVLEAIREGAPISRAEISRRAGISKPTVSLALQSLLRAGLGRETAPDPGRPSYGAVYFEPAADAAFVLGFDLGARFLRGAACDLSGEIRAREDVELPSTDAETAIETIAGLRTSLVQATELSEELIDGVDDFAFLSIGTGMGAGIVLRGELHRGHNGAAGEIDYALGGGMRDDVDACAEAVSALAVELGVAEPVDARAIFAAARNGDGPAGKVVAETARRIAFHVAPIAAVADVGLLVLGGGIGANG